MQNEIIYVLFMKIPHLRNITKVQFKYSTGEKPVLVECNDLQSYICKYRYSTAAGYKLAAELTCSIFAKKCWIPTPSIAIVNLDNSDLGTSKIKEKKYEICFGSRMRSQTIDNFLTEDIIKCLRNEVPYILQSIPTEWKVNNEEVLFSIESILNRDWITKSKETYLEYYNNNFRLL